MASAVRGEEYRRKGVGGSLAYDLDWAVRERELRHAGEAKTRQDANVYTMPEVQVRARLSISPMAFLSVSAVAVLSVLVLLSYVKLTALSANTVALRSELSELETKHVLLTAEYEQMFDMASVKEAAEAAGMGKPSSSQIVRLELSDGDTAVVYQQESPEMLRRLLASLHGGIYAVVEYFD